MPDLADDLISLVYQIVVMMMMMMMMLVVVVVVMMMMIFPPPFLSLPVCRAWCSTALNEAKFQWPKDIVSAVEKETQHAWKMVICVLSSTIIVDSYRGFLKWWYPTTMGFPTKNDHFGVFWGYHHLRKHPYCHEALKPNILVLMDFKY